MERAVLVITTATPASDAADVADWAAFGSVLGVLVAEAFEPGRSDGV
jgi:hypothetical protein